MCSDNGLVPFQHQAIMWTDAGILLIWPLETNFSEILNKIHTFFIQENAFENVILKMAAILSRPQCVNPSFFLFQEQLYIVLQNLLEAGADPCIIPQAVPKHTLGVGTRIDAYGHRVLFTEGRWRQLSQHLFRMGVERTMYDAFNPMNNHFTTQAGINLIHLAAWRGDARCLAQLIHRACVQCADAISDIYERLESNGDLPSQSVRTSPKDVSDSGTNLGNKCVVSVSASCQSPTCPVRAVTTENCNALHYLYCYCNKPADLITCTRLLLRCGLSCHLEDKLENTPIFLLVRNALTKLSFIRHMANSFTEETISKSETEDNFHSVICECLHVMAEYGVDISRPNSDGVNPFRELFRYFSHDTVYGFDKEVQWNNYDIVPFTFDVKSLLRVARVLLDYQCDVSTYGYSKHWTLYSPVLL